MFSCTALFPHFLNAESLLIPQFLFLTGLFMLMSFGCLFFYAVLALRSRQFLVEPLLAKWVNRVVGTVFVSFGAALRVLRRPLA